MAAGQLIDRAGALLGLPFPSGAELEQLANAATEYTSFPPKVTGCAFSLSGMENKIKDLVAKGQTPQNIAAFTIETIGNAVEKATMQAVKQYPLPVLCAGGVMSNRALQERMARRFGARFAEPVLSGDNAVGVAVLAAKQNGEVLTYE